VAIVLLWFGPLRFRPIRFGFVDRWPEPRQINRHRGAFAHPRLDPHAATGLLGETEHLRQAQA
jgi:hypothetical protein